MLVTPMLRKGAVAALRRRYCTRVAEHSADAARSAFEPGKKLEMRTLEDWQEVTVEQVLEDGTVVVRRNNFLINVPPAAQARDLRGKGQVAPNLIKDLVASLSGLAFWFGLGLFPLWISMYWGAFDKALVTYYTPTCMQYANKDPFYYEQEQPGYVEPVTWHPPMLAQHQL